MHPRTLIILVAAILLASFGVRLVVFEYGLLPVSEQALLKKATSLTVSYSVPGKDAQGNPAPVARTMTIEVFQQGPLPATRLTLQC